MKRTLVIVVASLLARATLAFSRDDITFWTGKGSNRSALVIDWNDGKEPRSLAWGFRWDGKATGEDMFRAVVTSDPLLFSKAAVFSFGFAVNGVGYDSDRNGLPLSDGTVWPPNRLLITDPTDGAKPLDPQDRYVEGWNTGFWSYWLSQGTVLGQWSDSQVGMSDRQLSDGSWDGLSFAPNFIGSEPDTPVAAPEPCSLAVFGAAGLLARGRKRHLNSPQTCSRNQP